MLPAEPALVLYVVGVGYLAMLAWAGAIHDLIGEPRRLRRLRRFVVRSILLGVAHPGFALAAWDIARQLGNHDDDGGDDARFARRAAAVALGAAAASGAAVVVAWIVLTA